MQEMRINRLTLSSVVPPSNPFAHKKPDATGLSRDAESCVSICIYMYRDSMDKETQRQCEEIEVIQAQEMRAKVEGEVAGLQVKLIHVQKPEKGANSQRKSSSRTLPTTCTLSLPWASGNRWWKSQLSMKVFYNSKVLNSARIFGYNYIQWYNYM